MVSSKCCVSSYILLYISRVWNQCDQKLFFEPTKLKCHWNFQLRHSEYVHFTIWKLIRKSTLILKNHLTLFWNLKHLLWTFTHKNKISRIKSQRAKILNDPHCEGNHEKSIPSVSPGFITISIGVHPSRSQIKNEILRLFQT